MKGNIKIGLTGELAALIRAEQGDKFSELFVTNRVKRIFYFSGLFLPEKKLKSIFKQRVYLSEKIQKAVKDYDAEQIIELGSGSSTLGLNFALKNSNIFIETDFEDIIKRKEKIILENGLKKENHLFVGVDFLKDDLYKKVKRYLKKGKRTLVFSEGVVSYLDEKEFETLINNISKFFDKINGGGYLSHDIMKSGEMGRFWGNLLVKIIKFAVRSKIYSHFSSSQDVRKYFSAKGFDKKSILSVKPLIYLVEKNGRN